MHSFNTDGGSRNTTQPNAKTKQNTVACTAGLLRCVAIALQLVRGKRDFFQIYINYVIKEKTVGLSFISSQALTNGSHGDDDGSHSSTVANILRD